MATEQQRFEAHGEERCLQQQGVVMGASTVSSILSTYILLAVLLHQGVPVRRLLRRIAAKAKDVPCFSCDKDKTNIFFLQFKYVCVWVIWTGHMFSCRISSVNYGRVP